MSGPDDVTAVTIGGTSDARFGSVRWWCGPRRVTVAAAALPTVEILRTGNTPPLTWIPLGTRRVDELSMSVDGRPVGLFPGKGALSRRSYRVAVETDDGPLLITPSSPSSSRLVRGTSHRGENELGIVTHTTRAHARIEWSEPVNVLGLEVDVPTPTPTEAGIGYALALAFGTGAQFVGPALFTALSRLLPG